jgi:aspartate 1-decarboxylase
MVRAGDKVIVVSYGAYEDDEIEGSSPVVVHVDEHNRIVGVDGDPEVLLSEVPS